MRRAHVCVCVYTMICLSLAHGVEELGMSFSCADGDGDTITGDLIRAD